MLSYSFTPFPALCTERLLLKQITEPDAPAIFELRSHPEVMKYVDRPPAQSIDEALAFIKLITEMLQSNEAIMWGLFLKEQPDLLRGTITLWHIQKEHYRAEFGYMLHPSSQGKGLMQEAITKVLNYGFEVMKLHSVEAIVNPSNQASIRLLKRNGFVREGYFKENYFYNGQFLDSAVYSLLAPE